MRLDAHAPMVCWQAYPKGFYRLALALDGQGKTEDAKLELRHGMCVRGAQRSVVSRLSGAWPVWCSVAQDPGSGRRAVVALDQLLEAADRVGNAMG
jgi:hypothetical protein